LVGVDPTAALSLNVRSQLTARRERRSVIALAVGVASGCYVIAGLAVLCGMQFTSFLDVLIVSTVDAISRQPVVHPTPLTTLLATFASWTGAVGVAVTGGLQALVMPVVRQPWGAVSVGIGTAGGGMLGGAVAAVLVLG
jgi:hypothetical protein